MPDVGNDIDNLRFSIILDDSQFRKKMKETEELANKFEKSVREALVITNLLKQAEAGGAQGAKQKATAQKEVVSLTRQELEAKMAAGTATKKELSQLAAIVRANKALLDEEKKRLEVQRKQLDVQDKQERNTQRRKRGEKDLSSAISGNTSRLMMQNGIMKEMSSYVMQYASVLGAVSVVRNLVRITGEFEAQHQALRAILQDRVAADEIFDQLKVLAVKSPYTFKDLTSYAKQLTAFSVPVNEVYETTKKLADVSAGLGVDMGRIILAYGQVRSAEFLRGTEVRQFTEAGVPILKDIADQFAEIEGRAISVGEVFDRISKRQVPFSMVEEAFNRMTSAGGKFYNMQEVLAETVKGKISNLQDAWEIMLSKIGDAHSGTIKGILSRITNLLANYQSWISIVKDLIRLVGLYTAGVAVYNTIMKTTNALTVLMNGYNIISSKHLSARLVMLGSEISLLRAANVEKEKEIALLKTAKTARQAALGVLSLLLTVAWGVVSRLRQKSKEAMKDLDAINSAFGKLQATTLEFNIGASRVEKAFAKMKEAGGNAEDKTNAFRKAIDDLKKQFPMFVDDHIKLANSVDELGRSWDEARGKMNQYFADEARGNFHNDIVQQRDESIDRLSKDFSKYIGGLFKDKSVAKINASTAWQYVTGTIGRDEFDPVLRTLSASMQDKTKNRIDYSGSILGEIDKYVKKYNEIIGKYEDAQDRFDSLLHQRGLNDTRKAFNEEIYEAFAKQFSGSFFKAGGEASVAFKDMSGEEQRKLIKSYLDYYDIAFTSEQEVDQWAKLMRAKLADGKIPDSVKSVIRSVFDRFRIAEDPGALVGFQKDVKEVVDNFGGVLRKALEERGDMTPEAMDAFVEKYKSSGDGFRAKVTDTIEDYVEARVKDANDVAKSMRLYPSSSANLDNEAFAGLWVEDLLLKAISQKLYGEGVSDFSGNTEDAEKDANERKRRYEEYKREQVASIKQQFSDLKEMKAAYDRFREIGFDEGEAGGLLKNFFGKGTPEGGFGSAFEALAAKMEKFSKNEAQDIRNFAAGKDWKEYADGIADAATATRKFKESLEDLRATTRRLKLDGFSAELDKIIVDADSKNRKLRSDWMQKLEDFSSGKKGWMARYKVENPGADDKAALAAWNSLYESQKQSIEGLIKTQTEYNNKVAQGQINKKADEWLRSMLEANNIDLTNMSDKSLAQVNVLIERMEALASDESLTKLIPPELVEDAGLINADFAELLSSIKKIASTKIGDLRVEKMKKTMEGVRSLLSVLGISADTSAVSGSYSTLSQRLSEVAIAQREVNEAQKAYDASKKTGDLDKQLAAYLALAAAQGKLKKATDAAAKSQAEFVASLSMASVSAFASLLGKVGDALKKMGEASEKANLTDLGDALSRVSQNLQAAAAGYAAAYSAGAGAYSWIGAVVGGASDLLGQVVEAASMHRKVMKEDERRLEDYKIAYRSSLLEMASYTSIFGDQMSKSARDAFDKMTTAAEKSKEAYDKLKGTMVITKHRSWISSKKTQKEYLSDLYPGLFGEDGHIDADLASRLINDLPKAGNSRDWNADVRQMLQEAVDIENAWKEAKDALDGYISSFTGDWASSLADAMWDAVASGEDAWGEWHRVASDAIADIGKQMLTEMIQKAWLGKYEKEMEAAFSSGESPDVVWGKVGEIAERMFNDVDANYEKYLEMTKSWQDKMVAAGYSLSGNESESLGNGFKSITEDAAHLLASYVNAIRADVSFGRMQRERIAVAVEGQSARYVTLNDYLAKVQADTSNIADSNRRILARLEGFIRDFSMPSEYGDALKVQMVN